MFRKFADQLSRFIVGPLFIFSGLIKLNDPIGTEYKMEEYFEVFADSFGSFFLYLKPWSLEIGLFLIVLEVVLGIAVLLWYRMYITSIILLVLMVFFTFLTFYSAYFNKVTDCGCFGDFIKLTPWQSFSKDVFLMIFVLHLFWYRRKYYEVLPKTIGDVVIAASTIINFALGIYAIQHLPFIDFRAYAIGNSIPQQMKPEESPIFEYVFLKKGSDEEITSEKYLGDTTLYKFVRSDIRNPKKATAKIVDFNVTDTDGNDSTQSVFKGAKLLITLYDVNLTSTKDIEQLTALTKGLEGKVDMMILTASPADRIDAFRHEHQLAVPFYFTDATVLKTMVRSNPGITLWVEGTVKGMWHHNDTPEPSEVIELTK